MKQKKKGKICFVIYIAGERILFFIYEVFSKQKKENSLIITTLARSLFLSKTRESERDNCLSRSLSLLGVDSSNGPILGWSQTVYP